MSAPPVHPLPPSPACTCNPLALPGEPSFDPLCSRWLAERAATTPPPVRVIDLAGGGVVDPLEGTLDEQALGNVAWAQQHGAWAIEGMTRRLPREPLARRRMLASIKRQAAWAAHHARLALGAS